MILAIGWSRIAPRLGVAFALSQGWEEDVGYFYEDNRVRQALGVDTDAEARDELIRRIKANKAGTLVKLELFKRTLQLANELSDNEGASGIVKEAIFEAMSDAIGVITIGMLRIPSKSLLTYLDNERLKQNREAIRSIESDITYRIASRKADSSTQVEQDRPRDFGSKSASYRPRKFGTK